MRVTTLLLVASASLAFSAEPANQDASKMDAAALQGKWSMVSAEIEGQCLAMDGLKKSCLAVNGSAYDFQLDKTRLVFTFQVDAGKNPRAIDLTVVEGPEKGKVFHGIYKLEEDRYTICRTTKPGQKRPTAFSTTANSGLMMVVWAKRPSPLKASEDKAGFDAKAPTKEAARSPLSRIPESATIVIHLRGVERTQARLLAFLQNALPKDMAGEVQAKFAQSIKEALGGRQLKGIPTDGPVFLVFSRPPTSESDTPKVMAFLLRVSDYSTFLSGILNKDELETMKRAPDGTEIFVAAGKNLYLRHHDGYVVIGWSPEAIHALAMPARGLDRKLRGEKARKFLDSDLSAYVDMPAVVKAYPDFFKNGRDMFEKALWQFSGIHDEPAAKQSLRQTVDLFFQAAEDAGMVLGCVDFRPDGLAVHAIMDFKKDSKTVALLKDFTRVSMAELAQFPDGYLAYSAMRIEPAMLQLMPRALYAVSVDPRHTHQKAVEDALRELNEAGPRLLVTGFQQWGSWGATNLPWNDVQVWTYDDPVKATEARLRLLRTLKAGDSLEGAYLKEDPVVMAAVQKHRGYKLHSAQVTWDVERMLTKQFGPDMPEEFHKQMKTFLSRMIGAGKHVWFGSNGKDFVQISASDWDSTREKLDQLLDRRKTLSGQKAFEETRKHLPPNVTALHLLEMSAYGEFMAQLLEGLADRKGPTAAPARKGETAYVGFAITAEPNQLRLDGWLPAAALAQFYRQIKNAIPTPRAEEGPAAPVQEKTDLKGSLDAIKANVAKVTEAGEKERWQTNIDLWQIKLGHSGAIPKTDLEK